MIKAYVEDRNGRYEVTEITEYRATGTVKAVIPGIGTDYPQAVNISKIKLYEEEA